MQLTSLNVATKDTNKGNTQFIKWKADANPLDEIDTTHFKLSYIKYGIVVAVLPPLLILAILVLPANPKSVGEATNAIFRSFLFR